MCLKRDNNLKAILNRVALTFSQEESSPGWLWYPPVIGIPAFDISARLLWEEFGPCARMIDAYCRESGIKASDIEANIRILSQGSCFNSITNSSREDGMPDLSLENLDMLGGLVRFAKANNCLKILPNYIRSMAPNATNYNNLDRLIRSYSVGGDIEFSILMNDIVEKLKSIPCTAFVMCAYPRESVDSILGREKARVFWSTLEIVAAVGVGLCLAGLIERAVLAAAANSAFHFNTISDRQNDLLGHLLSEIELINGNTPEEVKRFLDMISVVYSPALDGECPNIDNALDPYPELNFDTVSIPDGPPPSGSPDEPRGIPTNPSRNG